jgi:hypothetical protein
MPLRSRPATPLPPLRWRTLAQPPLQLMERQVSQRQAWRLAHRCTPLLFTQLPSPVPCAHGGVGAPLVVGGSPRMDAPGLNQLCEQCGARLSRCKGKQRKCGAGHICQSCFDKQRRGTKHAVPAPLAHLAGVQQAAERSHKRRAASDPGESAADHATTLAPLSLPLHKQPLWASHRWALRPSCRRSRAEAAAWHALVSSGELRHWEIKRGGFQQHDTHLSLPCSLVDAVRVRLLSGSEQLGRDMLRQQGVDPSSLLFAALKIVRMETGEGEQEIHYDVPEYEQAQQCFTVLLYLAPTLSTAVPSLPLAELRDTFTPGESRPPGAALSKLTRQMFYSTRVEAGDAMLFRCDVPHYGVANPDAHTRYVAFMLFSPRGSPLPDTEEQRYPHGVED